MPLAELDIWNHAINVHMQPDENPYDTHGRAAVIRRQIEMERRLRQQHWTYGGLSLVLSTAVCLSCFVAVLLYKRAKRQRQPVMVFHPDTPTWSRSMTGIKKKGENAVRLKDLESAGASGSIREDAPATPGDTIF